MRKNTLLKKDIITFDKDMHLHTAKLLGMSDSSTKGEVEAKKKEIERLVITEDCEILPYEFANLPNLKTAVFKKSAIVGTCGFRNCRNLNLLAVGGNADFGVGAFLDCISLIGFHVEGKVEYKALCFGNCISIGSVTLGGLTSIVECNSFLNCTGISMVYMNGQCNRTLVQRGAFSNCINIFSLQCDDEGYGKSPLMTIKDFHELFVNHSSDIVAPSFKQTIQLDRDKKYRKLSQQMSFNEVVNS